MYAYYHISGSLLKIPEIVAYANFGLIEIIDKVARRDISSLVTLEELPKTAIFFGIFAGARFAGGLNSYLATKLAGQMSGRNLNTAAIISAIPVLGVHLAIPAQVCVDAGSKSETIWHYTVRKVVAKISKISPSGGWGTELEGKLWNLFGKKIERWAGK